MNICGIRLALDNIEDTDVAARLARRDGDHAILGLEESAHDVQDGSFTHRLRLLDVGAGERRVGRNQEVRSRCRNE